MSTIKITPEMIEVAAAILGGSTDREYSNPTTYSLAEEMLTAAFAYHESVEKESLDIRRQLEKNLLANWTTLR